MRSFRAAVCTLAASLAVPTAVRADEPELRLGEVKSGCQVSVTQIEPLRGVGYDWFRAVYTNACGEGAVSWSSSDPEKYTVTQYTGDPTVAYGGSFQGTYTITITACVAGTCGHLDFQVQ